jgi:mono/diheme cytochrome c family protein
MKLRGCLGVLGTVIALVVVGPSVAGDHAYVGAKKCKMCHLKQYTTWETTRMAKSFEVLKPGARAEEKKRAGLDPAADYTADPKCLGCHTTGYGKPGGFESLAATPDLVGVQCESCHGPGGDYLAKDKMSLQNKEYKREEMLAAGLVVPNAKTCTTTCHNEKSPFAKPGEAFDFEARKTKGTHEHLELKYKH